MNGIDVVVAITILMVFLFGIMFGVIAIVSRSFYREDKQHSVKGEPPDYACSGTRKLVGFSHRAEDGQPSREDAFPQGPAGDRFGGGWGDKR